MKGANAVGQMAPVDLPNASLPHFPFLKKYGIYKAQYKMKHNEICLYYARILTLFANSMRGYLEESTVGCILFELLY